MDEFYSNLLNSVGSKQLTLIDTNSVTRYRKGMLEVEISTIYSFKKASGVFKTVTNLIERVNKNVELDTIMIVRTIRENNVSIAVKFLSGDEKTLMHTEADQNLLTLSNTEILARLKLEA